MDSHVIQHPIETSGGCVGRFRCATGDLGRSLMFNLIWRNPLSPLCLHSCVPAPPSRNIYRSWEWSVDMETNHTHTHTHKDLFCAGLANRPDSLRWLFDRTQGVGRGQTQAPSSGGCLLRRWGRCNVMLRLSVFNFLIISLSQICYFIIPAVGQKRHRMSRRTRILEMMLKWRNPSMLCFSYTSVIEAARKPALLAATVIRRGC